jgi:hypothetical protein
MPAAGEMLLATNLVNSLNYTFTIVIVSALFFLKMCQEIAVPEVNHLSHLSCGKISRTIAAF